MVEQPSTLLVIAASDEQIAELAVLAGFDDVLLAQTTATRNRLRGFHVRRRVAKHNPRLAATLTQDIFDALDIQTVLVPGTSAASTIVPILATELSELYTQRAAVFSQVAALVEAHPLSAVLTSMPGAAVRSSARLLTEVVGKGFKTAGHLASNAGSRPSPGDLDGYPG